MQFNWDQWIQNLLNNQFNLNGKNILAIIFQIVLTYLVFLLIKQMINHLFQSDIESKLLIKNKNASPQRIMTLSKIIKNALIYLLYFFFFYSILSILGFPVATLIASAGIASVAFGMGAKEFVTDMINGFFIISEGQFDVEEMIELPDKNIKGKVKEVGIRSTTLLAPNGNLYFIPNSEINIVNNLSREASGFTIELPVYSTISIKVLSEMIERETKSISEEYQDFIREEPNILGITKNANQQYIYQIIFKVNNGEQFRLSSKFYERYLSALYEISGDNPLPIYQDANIIQR